MRRAALAVLVGLILAMGAWATSELRAGFRAGRMRRTMGDLRTVATALESWSLDHRAYPVGVGEVADLAPLLEPTYVKKLPTLDGWGRPLRFAGDGTQYVLASSGPDGLWSEAVGRHSGGRR